MRPNQQNNKNRSRGRNNNGGRKHGNPLSRNYESNGPDGKVRGNASHVAEKYLQLARDAQSAGDSVSAENFLQHAEHYFRLVASAQQQQNMPRDQAGQVQDNSDDDDDFTPVNDRFASPEPTPRPAPPQQPQAQQPASQPAQSQPQSQPAGQQSSGAESADAASAGADASPSEDGQANADGDGARRRERPRRRRARSPAAEQQGGGDQPEAAKADVGDLPAFLTASTPAAE